MFESFGNRRRVKEREEVAQKQIDPRLEKEKWIKTKEFCKKTVWKTPTHQYGKDKQSTKIWR